MKTILIFILATVVNVSLSTVRSICTIKGGKWISAITNAICYGFYPLIVMLTAKGTVDIIVNMIITAVANFVCVWVIKFVEEKTTKDKIWLVKVTIPTINAEKAIRELKNNNISFTYYNLDKYFVFDTFCETQAQTAIVTNICTQYLGKAFASENKLSL